MRRTSSVFLLMNVLAITAPLRADDWTLVAPMPEPKTLLAGATGGDGRIYAIGGTSEDGPPVNSRSMPMI